MGIGSGKESPSLLNAAGQLLRGQGVELKQFYLMMGQTGVMYVMEAENGEAVARASLLLRSSGKIRLESMRAFTGQEYRDVIGSLP